MRLSTPASSVMANVLCVAGISFTRSAIAHDELPVGDGKISDQAVNCGAGRHRPNAPRR